MIDIRQLRENPERFRQGARDKNAEVDFDRLLALDADELDVDRLKWVTLMVLSSQPGEEDACSRMEDILFDLPPERPH